MIHVYILHSRQLDRFYAGISRFGTKRQRQHLKGQSAWTSRANDWQEVWAVEADTYAEARMLERKIKARGARRYLGESGVAVPPAAG